MIRHEAKRSPSACIVAVLQGTLDTGSNRARFRKEQGGRAARGRKGGGIKGHTIIGRCIACCSEELDRAEDLVPRVHLCYGLDSGPASVLPPSPPLPPLPPGPLQTLRMKINAAQSYSQWVAAAVCSPYCKYSVP